MSVLYADFVASKRPAVVATGMAVPALCEGLFPHQRHCTEFALTLGRAALFLDTGLGKSRCAIEWAYHVAAHTSLPVLILTPLAVAPQFVAEGRMMGRSVVHIREADEIGALGVYVANYERLDRFAEVDFGGVVLDESSILKSFDGRTKQALVTRFAAVPFRLCCTATPAPNDCMELGNHAEFLGVMQAQDMLQRWFINDTETASQSWRLKGHAVADFWDWVCSWARCLESPADMGFDGSAYVLPELREITHLVDSDILRDRGDALFRLAGVSATNLHREQRASLPQRVDLAAELVAAEPDEPWLIWCETDRQADALRVALPAAVEVRGSQSAATKESHLVAFSEGRERIMVTKPKIAGFGLNWQHCARVVFIGLTFSYESYYQAIRRCWRFGQKRPVHVHIITSASEASILAAVRRKAEQHDEMKVEMREAVGRAQARTRESRRRYQPMHHAPLPSWMEAS